MSEDYVIKDWEDFHISELIEISEKYGMKLGTISRDSDSKKEENWSLVQKLEDVKDILVILYNGNGVQVGFGEERIGNFTSYGSNQVDEIFTIVEDQPTPPGGMSAFYKYVATSLRYPAQARRMGIEGKVFVQFVVGKDGTLTDVQAIKGIGAGCDEEAVRVISRAKKWSPGKQRGRPVRVRMILPITFKLG